LINANKYVLSINSIQILLKDMSQLERFKSISIVSVATYVPIIAVCAWINELYEEDPKILDLMKRLMIFYNIDKVLIKEKEIIL
jgi:hypothetical protein